MQKTQTQYSIELSKEPHTGGSNLLLRFFTSD